MTERAIRLLEFPQVISELVALCRSPQGAERIEQAEILTDPEQIDGAHDAVAEARALYARTEEWPSLSFPEVRSSFTTLEKGGTVLEAEELAMLATHLRSATALGRHITKHLSEGDALYDAALDLPVLTELTRAVEHYLEPNGELKEVAELKEVRGKIKAATRRVSRIAESYLHASDLQGVWTSDVAPQRDGRVVLPLHANHRGRVRGVVHELSSSGTTLYVEPDDLLESNNALREAHDEYRQVVLKILRDLTNQARTRLADLEQLTELIAYLDATLCRARYADKHRCTRAERDGVRIYLSQARHPLLGSDAVPVDIVYPEGVTTLVITGPNTGGKTVALKTLGMLVLMNQFGIPVPADEGSTLPCFETLYADIGDEQSIAQSLSTFSGHMKSIGSFLDSAGRGSLVLLDELGAGTDPEEGSALAMAILDRLRESGATSFVTTHHSALKSYAYSHDDVSNASVEFDTDSLRPTFRLLTGVPGSSHAVTIAERTGIPAAVVSQAKSYLGERESDSAQIIRRLTEQEHAVREQQRRLTVRESRAHARERELAEREESVSERERSLREQDVGTLQQFTAEARKRLENLIRELREGEVTRADTKRAKEFVQELEEAAEEESREIEQEKESAAARSSAGTDTAGNEALTPGSPVRLKGPGTRGVLRRRAKGNRWVVQTDTLTVTVPESDLEVTNQAGEGVGESRYSYSLGTPSAPLSQEIDVRGMRMPEADSLLRRHIDDALLANMSSIGIIHGKGEGILQSAVRDLLKQHPGVERYEYALPEQGGFGKTIAYLKRE